MYALCGVDARPFIETSCDRARIRAYANSGLVAARRRAGVFAQWKRDFLTLAEADHRPRGGDIHYMDRLSLAATLTRIWDRVQVLDGRYNYPLVGRPLLAEPLRSARLDQLVHVHYNRYSTSTDSWLRSTAARARRRRHRLAAAHLPFRATVSSATRNATPSTRRFLSIASLFSDAELGPLRAAADELAKGHGPNVVGELDDASTVRMVFGAHVEDDLFARLSRHPRLLGPVEQSLGEPVHLFQSRLNVKSGFAGGGWAWHQDFNQWYRQDGMRTPRATVVGVFLDDVNPCNGPLMMIPRSQQRGFIPVPDMMDIPFEVITEMANANGIVPLMGPPGTAIFFNC